MKRKLWGIGGVAAALVLAVGILVLTYLSSGSMLKALMMAAVGLILSGIGMDSIAGVHRYTYNFKWLIDGIKIVPMVMVFSVSLKSF